MHFSYTVLFHRRKENSSNFFLDISKAFDKVWLDGLIYKLKQNGVAGDLLDTLTNFLKERNKE